MKKISLFGRGLGAKAIVALAVMSVAAMALVTEYVTGTATGTVQQAIIIEDCDTETGTCSVADNKLSFSWDMGEVYQGSEYVATITLKNLGNKDIDVKPELGEISVTGGNEVFESEVCVSPGVVTVPAGDTEEFDVIVKIHPAEEPDEQYTININVAPVTD